MSYSNLYVKKNQNVLRILGVVSVLSFLLGVLFFIEQWGYKNGWQKTQGIDKVYVVNRSPHGFELIWSTKNPVKETQWVEAGTKKNTYSIKGTAENNEGVYKALLGGLTADTTYYYRIRVGSKTYILPSLVSESVHTPKEAKETPVSPAYGKVLLPSTNPYANGLLIYEIDGYYPLAAFTKETGEWLIPLTGLVEKKSNSIVPVSNASSVLIRLFSYPNGSIRTVVGQTRPLKQAITAGTSLQIAQTTERKNESVLGAAVQNKSSQPDGLSSIIYPKEGALIPGSAPLIRGVAPSGTDIIVLIQGSTKQYSYRTKTNEKGEWLIQYPLVLAPGKYTIIATVENNGTTSTIVPRTFSIIKSGEQVLGVATGTPTLAPTVVNPSPIPTNTPTPTSITSNSQFPTGVIPTRFVPTATPPVTGGGISGFLFGALICIVIGAGLVLAF